MLLDEEWQARLKAYLKRAARVKCRQCRAWMRFKPTKKTPSTRRCPPHANICTGCMVLE